MEDKKQKLREYLSKPGSTFLAGVVRGFYPCAGCDQYGSYEVVRNDGEKVFLCTEGYEAALPVIQAAAS